MQKNLKRASAMILSLAMAVQFGLTDSYYINANDEQPVEETKQAETTKVDESKNEPETPQEDSSEDNQAQTDDVNQENNQQSQDETTTTEKVTVEISYVTEEDGSTLMDSLTNTYDVGYRLDQDSNVFNTNHEEYVLDYAIINNDEGNKITKDQASENGLCVASGMTSVKFVYKKSTVQKSHKAKKAQGTKMDSKGEDDSEDDIETASDSETYKLYHYALIPGKLMDSTESADSRWFGIGVTSISGVSNPSGLEYGIQSNFTYKQEGVVKTLYPDITYNSKTYKYAATGSENADKEGYYTLIPARVMIADGANAGNNSYNPTASGKTYHQDYTIVMNEKNIYTVTYNVMDPGETTYGVLNDYSQRVDAGTSESKLKQPASEDVPNVKTDNEGNKYTFSGWYIDQACTVKANFNGSVTANTNYYGKYVAETYTVKYDSNGGSDVADKTLKYNDVVDTSQTPTKEGYIFDGWYYGDTKVTNQKYATLAKSESTKEITLKAKWETELSATSEDVSKTYDGNGYGIEVKPNKTGATIKYYNEKTNQYDLTKCPTRKNVGKKTIKYEVSKKGYTTFTGQANVTITPATLKVITPSKSKTYDGTALTAEGSIEGFVNGETATFTTTGSQTNVGSSDNTYLLKFDGTAKESNYVISEKEIGKLTVTESTEEITVTTTGGEFTYNGQAHGATVSVSKLPKGYTVETATSSATATDVTEAPVNATCDTLVIKNASGEDVTSKLNVKKVDGSITITPATLKVTTPSKSKTYDGEALTAEGSIEGFVNGETATFTTTGSQTGVGDSTNTYSIDWNGTAKQSNYTVSEHLGTLSVSEYAEKITVTTTGGEFTYNGQAHGATVSVSKLPKGYTVETATSSATATDVTETPVTATCDTLVIRNAAGEDVTSKLNVKKVDGSITITPATLKVTTPSKSKTYDGEALTAEGSIEGFVNGETATFTTTGSQTKVGSSENTYEITWNGTAKKSNYTVSAAKGQLTVTESAEQIVVTTTGGEFTYNGQARGATVTVSELPKGYTLEKAESSASVTDVTKESVAATCDTLVIKNASGEDVTSKLNVKKVDGSITITPATLKVTTPSKNKTYDGEALTAEGSIEGFVNGETATFTTTGSQTKVGSSENTYEITWNGTAKKSNYTVSAAKGQLTVTESAEQIVVTTTGGEFTYNGQARGATVTVSELPKGYTLEKAESSASVTDVTKESVAATCDTLVIRNAAGVDVTSMLNVKKVDGTIVVKPATLTVTTPDASKPYDGKALKAAGSITGFVNGETATFTTTGSQTKAGSSENTYEIKWDGTAKKSNYTVSATKGQLTVNPKTVTVKADNKTKVYGTKDPELTATVTGTIGDDKISYTLSRVKGENIGNHAINVTGDMTQGNYKVEYALGTLTITRQSIVPDPENPDSYKGVTVNAPKDKEYNGKDQTWVPEVKDADGKALSSSDYKVSYDKEDRKNVTGTITVTITGTGNYTGTVTRTYQVTPRSIKLTSADGSKVYDGTPLKKPNVTMTGEFVDDEVTNIKAIGSVTEAGKSVKNTIAYTTHSNKGFKESNYKIEKSEGTLTITRQSIVPNPENPDSYKGVTVNTPKDVEYDGKEHKWSPVVTTKSGEKLEAGKDYKVSYDKDDFKNVGTIKVTITGAGNYTGTVTRTYKVTPKEYTVTTESATKTYSGTALTAGGKVEGIVSGETVEFTTTGSQTEVGTSKNTYTLEWKSAVETNYTLAKESIGELTVKAKSIVPDDSDKTGITVSEPSDSKYDGKEHKEVLTVTDTKTSKELVAGTDYSVTYSSDLVNAGTVTIKVAGLGNYTGSFTKTYKITKRSVTLTSATVSKVYDGSALTDTTIDVSGDGFVEGEGASYEVTGTQTEVGNSANSFEYKLNENTLASNYNITKVVGTLTITAAPTPVTPSNPTTPTTPTNPGTTNTSRITGTTTTQTRTPSTPTTTPSEASKDATDKVKKEKTPKEEKVEESATPKAKPESFWALINLICAIVTALFGLLLLISKRHKSEDEDDEEDETMDEESKEQEKKRGLFTRVLAVLITILSIVFFLITEDMSLPWTWTDQYTIWMVVIGVVQIVVFFVGRKWKNVDDDDDSEE